MTTKKLDSRIVRSRRDLSNALEELLQEKNLDDISITEITDRAMVSKNTFYNNFVDKADLLSNLFRRYADSVETQLAKVINENDDKDKALYECDKLIVHFFYSSHLSFERMVKNDKSRTLYWAVDEFISTLTKELIVKYPFMKVDGVPENLVSHLYSGALTNMIYYMYTQSDPIREEDLVHYIFSIITKPML
jgi:AcrR family transcriptional regulator